MSKILANTAKWFKEADGATDIDFIRAHEIVRPRGRIHNPISSVDILQKFRDRANVLGLKFKKEQAALLKPFDKKVKKEDGTEVTETCGGDRYIYLAEVEDTNHPDYALTVGFRNFGDKSLAFSGMIGTNVFCCENGLCTGIVKPSKIRHTIGNMGTEGLLDSKIDNVFSRFLEDGEKTHAQMDMMKATKLTDEIVGKFVRKAIGEWEGDKFVKNSLLGSTNLARILEDLESPERNSNKDNSCFRLLNACTLVTTHKMKNPNQGLMASRFCNNLIMSLIDPNFTPLGDVVDVAEETETEDGLVVIS